MKGLFNLLKKGSMSSLTAAVVNFILGCLKLLAFIFTGNIAMFAEMMHSFGDAANQLFVFLGSAFSKRSPNEKFPLGYGRLINLVCLIAVIIVGILSYETVKEGFHHIVHPNDTNGPLLFFWINIGVLAIGIVLEGIVLRKAGKEILEEAGESSKGLLTPFTKSYLLIGKAKPATKLVFMEDTVATAGGIIAVISIIIARLTGLGMLEGIASVIIGIMMFVIVGIIFIENAQGVLGIADHESEIHASRVILDDKSIADIKRLAVIKEGEALHIESLLEVNQNFTLKELSEIRKRIILKLLDLSHVEDVNIEFIEDDGQTDWSGDSGPSANIQYKKER
ncbi:MULTISPECIES: cation diffusion facilitator family transporter [Mammaliicoccus]|uniref:Cation diffusion facilitator family transporter n=1 Tax=Mammaliicoccus vitulinus TaxID=71237 RepID=A0A2T4PR57_9STAP|nr:MULTISPECIES: cation diffusion facilitator family transporter [Mammaliicoccus]HAL08511.1 cation diffusion facilitator family transporter [Staphylococcus sp.]PNZ35345.1 cation diffusion facilitator family transporter [Mammaliicoccus vitulinus]PTI28516.1 cation diffusion facilitator family transporter [Mammaliicoccus vitulinus]PTI36240.1 cation diffusion facilitator family transporter [Mammaliicoccus vitulinus]PTI69094.1 cation diffusion facilitator family transporter [Mammaliicoccus vitulinu